MLALCVSSMPEFSTVPRLTFVRQSSISLSDPNFHCVPASSCRLALFSARMRSMARGEAILWSRICMPPSRAVDVRRNRALGGLWCAGRP